jgi:hypothetical protein
MQYKGTGRERERERERERPVNSRPDMKKKPSRNMVVRKALVFFALNKAMEKKKEKEMRNQLYRYLCIVHLPLYTFIYIQISRA